MRESCWQNLDDPLLRRVDELLEVWARSEMGYRGVKGYAPFDLSCQDARSSVQWQSADEVNEERWRAGVVKAVDGAMDSLPALEQVVLRSVYANAVGPAVWRYGRLKGMSKDDIKAMHRVALTRLVPLLRARAVLD